MSTESLLETLSGFDIDDQTAEDLARRLQVTYYVIPKPTIDYSEIDEGYATIDGKPRRLTGPPERFYNEAVDRLGHWEATKAYYVHLHEAEVAKLANVLHSVSDATQEQARQQAEGLILAGVRLYPLTKPQQEL